MAVEQGRLAAQGSLGATGPTMTGSCWRSNPKRTG
jgi:hypothetical protein